MDLSTKVLGTSTAKTLGDRVRAHVLVIGRDHFARGDLATVECFNFIAAQNLTRALARLDVASTRDVFNRIPPSALAVPQVGAVALAVLGAAFEAKQLGGDAPLETWMVKHQRVNGMTVAQAIATFDTVKHRASIAAQRERRSDRARKHARRDTAHRLRVDRYSRRQQATG